MRMRTAPLASQVVLLVVDGLRPDAVTADLAPSLHALAERGWQTVARTVTPSVTMAALTSLGSGVSPARHGFTAPRLPSFARFGRLRPLPRELRRHGRSSVLVVRDLPPTHRLLARGLLGFAGFGGIATGKATPWSVAETAVRAARTAAFTAVYVDDCDRAGHAHGWMSDAYLEAVARVDRAVALLAMVLERAGCLLLVTADHGGGGVHPDDHDLPHPVNEAIPLIAAGRMVPGGMRCTAPAHLLDVPPTILAALGVAVPDCWEGRPLRTLLEGELAVR